MLQRERKGSYLGQTVRLTKQVVELDLELIRRAAARPTKSSTTADVCLIELGGAVGSELSEKAVVGIALGLAFGFRTPETGDRDFQLQARVRLSCVKEITFRRLGRRDPP